MQRLRSVAVRLRIHTPGQFLPLATGSFLAFRLAELSSLETVRLPEDALVLFVGRRRNRGHLERVLSANLEFRRADGSVVNKQKFILFGARENRCPRYVAAARSPSSRARLSSDRFGTFSRSSISPNAVFR